MPVGATRLRAAWRTVLQLSNVKEGENVLLLTSVNSNPQLIATAGEAASELGATVTRLDLTPIWHEMETGTDPSAITGRSAIDGNPVALAAMRAADLVIDLIFVLFTPAQREILQAGVRMLLVYDAPDSLVRVLPTQDDRRRVLAAKAAFAAGRALRVTSTAGTDLRAEIGDFPITAEYGYVDEPGRWDHWPSGFVARMPNNGTAEGMVVLSPGDIILPFKTYVQTPIRLIVEHGFITRIEGGLDAEYLKAYLKDFGDPNAFAVAHLGWGLQKRARWTALGMYDKDATIGMEARAFYGNFLFSTGPGGNHPTPCHLDIPMRHCSFLIDDVPMVIDGDVVPQDQRAS